MSRIQYTVVIFFIVIAVDKINRASFCTEKEIGNTTLRDLQIRHDTATGKSTLGARSRTKRWIEETFKTSSGESDSITSSHDLQTNTVVIPAGEVNSGGEHAHHVGHHGLHLTEVFMPTGKKANISMPKQLKHWERGRQTLLINLNPNGETGYDVEYGLVANVTRLTKIHKNFCDYDFIKIEKIVNGGYWKRYRKKRRQIKREAGFVDERMLFHGTSKAKEILQSTTGFDERYTQITGNMFGAGLYFAEHSSKSNKFAFGNRKGCPVHNDTNCDKCERQIILSRVALGKIQKDTVAKPMAHPDPGFHSVEGVVSPGGLKYPEYVVYKGEQIYPEYLITYKIVI